MHQYAKHFTIAEARAELPALRKLFADAHHLRAVTTEADETLGHQLRQDAADIGGDTVNRLVTDLVRLNASIAAIEGRGIQIKDFDRGLVDFPHLRDGREVFLCWELNEDDIEFWHDLEAGYGGRERLDA